MLCALTVRKLKAGTFEEFRVAFTSFDDAGNPPPGWVRFNMLRNAENPDEVICFGFFDGSVEELRANAGENNYAGQLEAIAPYVDSVGTDGLYEIVEEYTS
jgi:hypothetical protein